MTRWITLSGILLAVPSACIDRPENVPAGTSTFTVRDSAGIEIVEIPAAALKDLPRWTLASEPELEIGVVEGAPEYQFSSVGAVRTLSDGTIVVANESPMAIRYYDPSGLFIRQVGQEGEGPGDFGFLRDVHVLDGDSLLVADMRVRGVTVLAPEGSHG